MLQDLRFDEWADRWLAGFTGKPSSHRTYGHTIAYAKRAFGRKNVRDLNAGDVRHFLNVDAAEGRETAPGLLRSDCDDHAGSLQAVSPFCHRAER